MGFEDVDEMLEQAFSEAGKEPNFDFELDACGALPCLPPLQLSAEPQAQAQPGPNLLLPLPNKQHSFGTSWLNE